MSAFLVPHRASSRGGEASVCDPVTRQPATAALSAKEVPWTPQSLKGQGVRRRNRGYFMYQQGGRRMLVVVRRRGERLTIDASREVVVLEVCDGTVKLGIYDAPHGTESAQSLDA